ncbi:MAG: putative hybrid glycoside hydrolase, group 92(-20) family protein precursor [Bacteroidota bacterium]|jgi:predicted alpha-1,2-mannosidase|nr:putative hybrid glycoside hydrolase, group 92(-20) family protein precursor [Bacteroidota bacterium]
MRRFIYFLVFAVLFFSQGFFAQIPHAKFVNPFVGTGGAGHTFPGAVVPFGMVQLSPDTRVDGSWEGCSGYHYSDSVIYGFSHTHLSGTGVSDYGDILIMPTLGETGFKNKEYASKFSHLKEKAGAGYYQVRLNNGIDVQLTATQRTGIHQYTFPKGEKATIVIDLLHRDKTLHSQFKLIDSVTAVGSRISEGWANEQHVYFIMKFNKPVTIKKISTVHLPGKKPNEELEKTEAAILQFDNSDHKPLMIKVGISQTGIEGATKNLAAEARHWDFEKYKLDAEKNWEKELSKIDISTKDAEKATVFYTALYHCLIHPSLAGDVDGKYRGRDHKIHTAVGFTPYTVFSLWDTFRALHPLFTIIEQKRTADIVHSFLHQYKESGRLPVWELSANETNCMIGFHSVSVIADAITKNINGFDKNAIYEAMVATSNDKGFGIPVFNQNNCLQMEDESESVSKTLEYAYDNWCIAQVSKKLNKKKDYELFIKRAQANKNVYDKQTGFMRPRKNGNWLSPFDPREVNNHFTEANSWQYSFFAPQDVTGLIILMGGEKKMEQKLDELFKTSTETTGRTQVDISGLIGQYAHGNEPSQHMSYLYNYIGKPHKTQEKVYQILTEFYKNDPDGLIGNEDCGQMSAWYVLSSMGIYQVCPGKSEYTIGFPLYDNVKIHLENGKTFEISRQNPSPGFQYIQSSLLNGKVINSSSLMYQTIVNGGKLEFIMQEKLDDKNLFGKSDLLRPSTSISDKPIIPIPVIISPGKLTETSKTISIEHPDNKVTMVYTLDGSEPSLNSKIYTGSFTCDSSTVIKAKAVLKNESSNTVTSHLYKKPNTWTIALHSEYSKQYDAGGDDGIIDGQHGTTNWRSGGWQGYQGKDFSCIVDLGKPMPIQFVNTSFLQDSRSWILFPKLVEYSVSEDGLSYMPFGTIENGVPADDYSPQMRTFFQKNTDQINVRFIKIKATNYGKLPDWHQGRGGDAFIFIDEIEAR